MPSMMEKQENEHEGVYPCPQENGAVHEFVSDKSSGFRLHRTCHVEAH